MKRNPTSMIINTLIFLGIAYLSAVAFMYFMQDGLTFPAHRTNYDPKSTRELPNAAPYSLKTPDGTTLRGIHFAAKSQNAPLIIVFSGNAHDVISYAKHIYNSTSKHSSSNESGENFCDYEDRGSTVYQNIHENRENAESVKSHPEAMFDECFQDDVNVIGLHYRSYGTEDYKSEGSPSQTIILQDALFIHDSLKANFKPTRIILSGYSLGSSVAAYVSSQRQVAGIILFTPFKSAVSLAKNKYPWLPVHQLYKHTFKTIEFMRNNNTPTAIISAQNDSLIPKQNLAELRAIIPNLILDEEIKNATHGDILNYKQALTIHNTAYQLIP